MIKNKKLIFGLFLTGLIIIAYPHVAKKINSIKQKAVVEDFKNQILEKDEFEITKELNKIKNCNNILFYDENEIYDPFKNNSNKLNQFKKCLGIENDEIFSAIDIPKINLTAPIYLGASDHILSKGVGQVEGSSLPIGGRSTHSVLAGHRGMGTIAMFKDLDKLYKDDIFFIYGITGTLKYRVISQRIIYPDETNSLNIEEGKDLVTLLTCHPYGYNYQRLLIHAERVEQTIE